MELTEDQGIIQILLSRVANPYVYNHTYSEMAMNRMTRLYRSIKIEANLDIPDFQGCTPIFNASSHASGNVLFQVFYEGGAGPDVTDRAGRNVPHYAAAFGDVEHVAGLQSVALGDLVSLDEPDKFARNALASF